LAAALLLSSCCTYEPCKPKSPPVQECAWYLTCVEIDQSHLCNAGSLPVYRRSDGYAFGQQPVAYGSMQSTRDGLWSINVKFRETIVGFAGRSGTHEYDIITLAGKGGKDGCHIVSQNAMPAQVLTGVPTEVWMEKISDTKLRIQPATREK